MIMSNWLSPNPPDIADTLAASVFPSGKYTTQAHSHPQMPNKKENSYMSLAQIDFLMDSLITYCIRVH